jgi:putative transposase
MANLLIDVLRTYAAAKRFKVHDFVVMPNHFHLLITVDGSMTVEKAVQLIKGNFSYRAKMANLFIDVLLTYAAAKRFKVHDFVVMPNHFHLLIPWTAA